VIDRIVVWALTLKAKLSSERGQDIMEYVLITGGVALLLFAAVAIFTGVLNDVFRGLKNCVDFTAGDSYACP
jgi:hypothetical protein